MTGKIGHFLIGLVIGLLLSVFTSNSAYAADYTKVKAVGQAKNKKLARIAAREGAFEKYLGTLDSQRVKLIEPLKPQIYSNLETYVPEIVEIGEPEKRGRLWSIYVMASINETAIEQLISENLGRSVSGGKTAISEPPYLSFIFIARRVAEVESYKAREVDEGTAHESEVDDEAGTVDYDVRVETGGLIAQKQEKVSYEACNMTDVNAKVTEVFSKAGFQVVPPSEIDLEPVDFSKNYVEHDNLTSAMRKKATNAAKEAEMPFIALATMTVGRTEKDSATGMDKSTVTITAQIFDTQSKFTRTMASVGPVQFIGTGTNPKIAETNALITAATIASRDLVDQLRAKGVY